jgi:hypothetical protein
VQPVLRHSVMASVLCALIGLGGIAGSAAATGHRPSSPTTLAASTTSTFSNSGAFANAQTETVTSRLIEQRVLAVGDSVMLGAAEALSREIPSIECDASVGRQAADAIEVLRERHAAGTLGSVVLLHIGNNGPLTSAELEQIMELLGDVPTVLIMNLHLPRDWETSNNRVLGDAAGQFRNAVLVDWASASANRPDLFWDEQVHLRPLGAAVYADLVASYLTGTASVESP